MIHVLAAAERNIKNAVGRNNMNTVIAKVDPNNIDRNIINEAACILKNGGLVAFPTETVYGLGANGLNKDACKKIYEAKGRPSDNPLILHISDISQLSKLISEKNDISEKIIKKFWPGPLTLIFKKSEIVPNEVSGGLNTVAIRYPENPVAKALIDACGFPIAAPSANSSGKPSPTLAKHVYDDLLGKIDMIIDGGSTVFGLESTIIDVSEGKAVILRPGAITKEMLEEIIDNVGIDPSILKLSSDVKPKAPGMKYKHYSPNAEVILVKGDKNNVINYINKCIKEKSEENKSVGVMTVDENIILYNSQNVISLGKSEDFEEIGKNLFKALREFDYRNTDFVYSECFEEVGEGLAIMNRLKKSAGGKIINV